MFWIVLDGKSYAITSYNVHQRDDIYELWIERPNGKSMRIKTSKDKEEIEELKEALDFALKHGESTFEIV